MVERKHLEAIERARVKLHDEADRQGNVERAADKLQAAISAALSAFDESPWRSMDSAPRDGASRFLAVVNGSVRVVAWAKASHIPMWGWCLVDQGPEDCDTCDPVCWMPLPAAPEVDNAG